MRSGIGGEAHAANADMQLPADPVSCSKAHGANAYCCPAVRRSYKFLLRPTKRQEAALGVCLEDTRQLYNAALEERREAWRMGRHKVTFYSQDAQLKEIRAGDPERYSRWAFSCERAAIRRLDRAFQRFFDRVKTGQKPGYPRFKGRGWWDSIEWSEKNGACWDSVPHPTVTRVYLKGIGHVRVHQHQAVKGRVKTITAKREGRRWYVMLSCDNVPAEPLESAGSPVGIDLGVASFLTASDGTHAPNPRHLAATAGRLAAAQRVLARKKRGSNRRKKAAVNVAGLHGKVRRQRLDHAHTTALTLVRDHDVIVHEELAISGMIRRPMPLAVQRILTASPNTQISGCSRNGSSAPSPWRRPPASSPELASRRSFGVRRVLSRVGG
jgi:putative transposase